MFSDIHPVECVRDLHISVHVHRDVGLRHALQIVRGAAETSQHQTQSERQLLCGSFREVSANALNAQVSQNAVFLQFYALQLVLLTENLQKTVLGWFATGGIITCTDQLDVTSATLSEH